MRILLPAAVSTALVLSACPSYDARVVVPESTKEVNKVVAAGKPKPVDILFVVDNSGSMADEQEKLARNFQAFIEVLSANPDNDYRLAVVTTDLDEDGPDGFEQEGLVMNSYGPGPYFSPAGVDERACMDTDIRHGCFRGMSGRRIIESTLSPSEQVSVFAQTVRVGSCGAGSEKGLEAMIRAFTANCNDGFVRDDANLVIVIVTDEEDEYSDRQTDYFQALLTATGKGASQVRLAVIVGSVDGRASYCGKDGTANCGMTVQNAGRPTDPNLQAFWDVYNEGRWCSYFNAPDCCPARPGERYIQFAQQFEERVRAADSSIADVECRGAPGQRVACLIDSICQDDFSETLKRIARDLVVSSEFGLDPAAKYPPGVVVELNGTRLVNCNAVTMGTACDFTVSADGRTVSITNGEKVPGEEDQVQIYFIVNE